MAASEKGITWAVLASAVGIIATLVGMAWAVRDQMDTMREGAEKQFQSLSTVVMEVRESVAVLSSKQVDGLDTRIAILEQLMGQQIGQQWTRREAEARVEMDKLSFSQLNQQVIQLDKRLEQLERLRYQRTTGGGGGRDGE